MALALTFQGAFGRGFALSRAGLEHCPDDPQDALLASFFHAGAEVVCSVLYLKYKTMAPVSSTSQANSLPTEPSGNPYSREDLFSNGTRVLQPIAPFSFAPWKQGILYTPNVSGLLLESEM